MMPSTRFGETSSQEPRYNTKAVVRDTGVPADTFRAWERRYHVPLPHRTATGQRLYSERDIAIIRWLRDRTSEGLTVSQAVRLLEHHDDADTPTQQPISWEVLEQQLVAALLRLDAHAAEVVLGQAFAVYALEDVCLKLMTPALVAIGQGWHDGTVSVGQEHFATQLLRGKIQRLFSLYDVVAGQATIVAACAPGEQHDVGLLMVALLLVRRGYRVVYLGADVPLAGLLAVVDQVRADLVCLSTVTAATAPAVHQVAEALGRMAQAPLMVVGGSGAAALDDEGAASMWITGDVHTAVDQIPALLAAHRSATRPASGA